MSSSEGMLLDESMVEGARHEGRERERAGVMTAFERFLKTRAGKVVTMAWVAAQFYGGVEVASEQMDTLLKQVDASSETAPPSDSFMGDLPMEGVRNDLRDWIGAEVMRELDSATSSNRDRFTRDRRREDLNRGEVAEISGFETVGVSDELVARYLEEGFPRFMVGRRNVSSITFKKEHQPMAVYYHLPRGAEAAGICFGGEAGKAARVELYGSLVDASGRLDVEGAFQDVIIHELAHAIDWRNLDAVDSATRVRMLHQMVSHVRDDQDRLHFPYVEEINSSDPQEQLLNRTTEYYAMLTEEVFKNTPNLVPAENVSWSLHVAEELMRRFGNGRVDSASVVADVELVRALVKAYDPDFDWQTAAYTRKDLVREMRAERTRFELQRVASAIESPEARALVLHEIENVTIIDEGISETTFVRHVQKGIPLSEQVSVVLDEAPELYREANELQGSILSAQSVASRRLEREISQTDMPAYQELYTLLNTLADFHGATATAVEIDQVNQAIKEYRMAALHATPAHVEFAKKRFEIIEGVRGLPDKIVQRVTYLVMDALDAENAPRG